MKYYDTKDWLHTIFYIGKSETISKLWFPIIITLLYASSVTLLELRVFDLSKIGFLKDLSLINTLLGFVLSLLLVFRTNSAYDRWWEGRKLWGKLVNDSRNFAIKLNGVLPEDDARIREYFKQAISFFPFVLSKHLTKDSTKLALDKDYEGEFKVAKVDNPPIKLVNKMMHQLQRLYNEGKITGEQMVFLEPQLSGFLDVCGGCERIKNTPIPYSYSSFIKKFILVYVAILPLSLSASVGYAIIPLTAFIFYVLMSLELIAEEIEDPFSNDENDLPTEQIASNIEKNIEKIIYIPKK